MSILAVIIILLILVISTSAFIWLVLKYEKQDHPKAAHAKKDEAYTEKIEQEVDHIFDDKFREELHNRGRLHFEKIIGENAMFLQQDLRLTTSQLNDYMKTEITKKLQEEFAKYEESITDAKQLAVESITKTQEAIEEQRKLMSQQLTQELANEKGRLIKRFEDQMADIVNHYVLAAIGNQIDLNDQLEYILSDLETNKEAIIRDVTDGTT